MTRWSVTIPILNIVVEIWNLTFRTKLKNTNDDNTELDLISWSLEKQTDDGGLIIVQR